MDILWFVSILVLVGTVIYYYGKVLMILNTYLDMDLNFFLFFVSPTTLVIMCLLSPILLIFLIVSANKPLEFISSRLRLLKNFDKVTKRKT